MGSARPNFFRNKFLILLAILLVGSALRLYDPAFRSLWGDEVDSLFNAYNFAAHGFHYVRMGLSETLLQPTVAPLKGYHLPSFYVLLALWLPLFGVSEMSLRWLPIVFGLLSLPLMYLFGRQLFEEKTALLGTLLLAISGFAVFYSQEIRPYSLMLVFSLVSSACFWDLTEKNIRLLPAIGYVAASVMLLLSHFFGALVIGAQFAYLLLLFWQEKKVSLTANLFALQILAGLLVLPVYGALVLSGLNIISAGQVDLPYAAFPFYLKGALFFFAFSLGETVAPWNLIVVLPAMIIFGLLFIRGCLDWRDKRIAFLLTLTFFPVIVSIFFINLAMPKYLIICLPFYLMLLAYGLSRLKRPGILSVALLVLLVSQTVSISNYFNLKEYHNSNQIEPWHEIASQIRTNFRPGDVILTSNYFIVYRLAQYYLNISAGGEYPIVCLQDSAYQPDFAHAQKQLKKLKPKRIWLVTHIADDRAFAGGALKAAKTDILRKFSLIKELKYVPYASTLAAQLPAKRHDLRQSRITVDLYVRIL